MVTIAKSAILISEAPVYSRDYYLLCSLIAFAFVIFYLLIANFCAFFLSNLIKTLFINHSNESKLKTAHEQDHIDCRKSEKQNGG